jgi:hypothetical protein
MKEFKNLWEALDMPEPTPEEKIYYWMGKFKDQQNDMRQLVSAAIEALTAYESRYDCFRYCGPIDMEMQALRKVLEGK